MDKIAVLIPCYNESKTIEKVVTDFKKVLPEAVIYVYDNNSTDHTDEILSLIHILWYCKKCIESVSFTANPEFRCEDLLVKSILHSGR